MGDRPSRNLRFSLSQENYQKLMRLPNPHLHAFVMDAIELCQPESVFVCTDSPADIQYIRERAVATGEEKPLHTAGHTIHFDGFGDQARDKPNTRYLAPEGVDLGASLNAIERDRGLAEVRDFLRDSMVAREVLVRFFCLGPTRSAFSISGVQLTDSFYVAHSEDLLYRSGYEQFARLGDSPGFVRVLHSAGRLENHVSADVDKRRVYIDLKKDVVYSVNTQYAGNTVGFKKLSLRLAIRKADREGWLAEHMFAMGAHGPNDRVTYFVGAFPSFCGKTSTAMLTGETIVGDDIAYLRKIDGAVRAVNVESGLFGIIQDVNPDDDPVIWGALNTPGEVIFSNVLVTDGVPYWTGDGRQHPDRGDNFSGAWHRGKTDQQDQEIPAAHKNARYTVRLSELRNRDPLADAPEGVPVGGVVYGGRDSDTWVPVQEAFDWAHGVISMGASLESETTAATLGKQGVRTFQPMSNLDFVSIPLGRYVQNHLDFVADLPDPPRIFAVNYFLKGQDGQYLNGMDHKRVWMKWMELRVHDDVSALASPTGHIPRYADLRRLFREVLDQEYTPEQYDRQFTIRVPENLAKIDRIEEIYRTRVPDAPQVLFDTLAEQRERLESLRASQGDHVSPARLARGAPALTEY